MERGNAINGIELLTGTEVFTAQPMIADLCARVFDSFDPDYLPERLSHVVDPVLHLVRGDDGEPLGFKLGYRRGPRLLYSWLGGVVPAARGRGLAAQLMQAQHGWAARQGYAHVETRTRAANNRMIIVNLKAGFRIVGMETDESGHPVVILRRDLNEKPDRA